MIYALICSLGVLPVLWLFRDELHNVAQRLQVYREISSLHIHDWRVYSAHYETELDAVMKTPRVRGTRSCLVCGKTQALHEEVIVIPGGMSSWKTVGSWRTTKKGAV